MSWEEIKERVWIPEEIKKRLPDKVMGRFSRESVWLALSLVAPIVLVYLFLVVLATIFPDPDVLAAKTKSIGILLPIYYGLMIAKFVAEYIQNGP